MTMSLTAEDSERLKEAAAKPASPWQAPWKGLRDANGKPTGAILDGKPMEDTAAAWAEFARRPSMPMERSTARRPDGSILTLTRFAMPPRRGRAPRIATNTRARGSRRSRATSTGPPGDGDPEPPPPPRRASRPSRPPQKLGSPGRGDVRPRPAATYRARGGGVSPLGLVRARLEEYGCDPRGTGDDPGGEPGAVGRVAAAARAVAAARCPRGRR